MVLDWSALPTKGGGAMGRQLPIARLEWHHRLTELSSANVKACIPLWCPIKVRLQSEVNRMILNGKALIIMQKAGSMEYSVSLCWDMAFVGVFLVGSGVCCVCCVWRHSSWQSSRMCPFQPCQVQTTGLSARAEIQGKTAWALFTMSISHKSNQSLPYREVLTYRP